MARLMAAPAQLPEVLSQIRDLMFLGDPVALYGQLHWFDGLRRVNTSAKEHYGSDVLVEFFGGLVVSLPESDVIARIGNLGPFDLILRIEMALQVFAQLEHLAQCAKMLREGGEDRHQRMRHILELEHRFDRMHGFAPHLRTILLSILKPLRKDSVAHLGFALADCVKVAEAALQICGNRIDALEAQTPEAGEERSDEFMTRFLNDLRTEAPQLEPDLPSSLSSAAGLPLEQTTKLVSALSVPVGQDLALTSLADDSPLRRKPIITVDGKHLWARPVDFYHMGLDWAHEVCRDNPTLLTRFDGQRQRSAEDLTEEALVGVFGRENVHRGVTYDLPGRPDIDVFVVLPDAILIVEVKGSRFSEAARKGRADRVETQAKRIIGKALEQNIRAWNYLSARTDGLKQRSGKKLLIDPATHNTGLVVTLDHIDPFYGDLDEDVRSRQRTFKNAILSVSDLLMICDILTTPAELFAYISRRAEITSDAEFRVFSEGDVLGTWCTERIPRLQPLNDEWQEMRALPFGIALLNEYYSHIVNPRSSRFGLGRKPSSGILPQVTDYLNALYAERNPAWAPLAVEVGEVHPRRWVEVGRVLERAANALDHGSRKSRKRATRARTDAGLAVNDRLRIRLRDEQVEVLLAE